MSNVTNREAPASRSTRADAQHKSAQTAGQRDEPQAAKQAVAAKHELERTTNDITSQAKEFKHAAVEQASDAAIEVRRAAEDALKRLRDEGGAMASRQKEAAAEEVSHLRDALHAAAEKLDEEDDTRVADVVRVAADQSDRLAHYLRNQSLNRLADDATRIARRHPSTFYGGMFLVGLAASRFLKASAQHGHSRG